MFAGGTRLGDNEMKIDMLMNGTDFLIIFTSETG